MPFEAELDDAIRYLRSDRAIAAFAADAYWPKWDGPWWHMLLLHEMGLNAEIPQSAVDAHVDALDRLPLKIFPIRPEELPVGVDPSTGFPCHCQLGTVYQVLSTRGVDVDAELPWIRPWFLAYQMDDGGLSCDNDAYRVVGECPSSMVGTIGAFEAILGISPRRRTDAEEAFLDRAAAFLVARELRLGSDTVHNAEERASAEHWPELCFPRFYFYDVLRGLDALTRWAEQTGAALPPAATSQVVRDLEARFGDGDVRIGRRGLDVAPTTVFPASDGRPRSRGPTTRFPLLDAVGEVGSVSPFLTAQWAEVRRRLR